MTRDYTRPGAEARWGWLWAIPALVSALFMAGVILAQGPSVLRIGVVVWDLVLFAYCWRLWRQTVRSDRELRGLLAVIDARKRAPR